MSAPTSAPTAPPTPSVLESLVQLKQAHQLRLNELQNNLVVLEKSTADTKTEIDNQRGALVALVKAIEIASAAEKAPTDKTQK